MSSAHITIKSKYTFVASECGPMRFVDTVWI